VLESDYTPAEAGSRASPPRDGRGWTVGEPGVELVYGDGNGRVRVVLGEVPAADRRGGRSNAEAHAPEIMRELIELAEVGRLRPVVGGTFAAAAAAAAHAAIEARKPIGKVVLVP